MLAFPDSLGDISDSFHACDVKTISFGRESTLTTIASSFLDCPFLRRMDCPSTLIEVANSFRGCTSFQYLTFRHPSNLRVLSGFSKTQLHYIAVPDSVEQIAGFSSALPDLARACFGSVSDLRITAHCDAHPDRFTLSLGRESNLRHTWLDRRCAFVDYPKRVLKRLRERSEWTELSPPPAFHAPLIEVSVPGRQSDVYELASVSEEGEEEDREDLLPELFPSGSVEDLDLPPPPPPDRLLFELSCDDAERIASCQQNGQFLVEDDPLDPCLVDPSPSFAEDGEPFPELNPADPNFFIHVMDALQASAPPPPSMTPLEIINAITRLEQRDQHFFDSEKFGNLTEYVRGVTRPYRGAQPLFAAQNTGSQQCNQKYACTYNDCGAFFDIKVYQSGRMHLGKHQFEHTHPIVGPGQRHYHTLREEDREKIIELTNQHAPMGMIRTVLDLDLPSNFFYEARRDALQKLRCDQAQALDTASQNWHGWKTKLVPPIDGVFQGFFAVQVQIVAHGMCRETLSLDDTFCTNFFKMPLSGIVTVDPMNATQIVAFALLRDGSADALTPFLGFVREYMNDGQPRAFMIDRALAERLAISAVFPEAHICFCLMHIFRNLQQKCGRDHILVRQFWPAMRGTDEQQRQFHDLLAVTYVNSRNRPGKKGIAGCCARLYNEWDNWAPCRTRRFTKVLTTGRIEGSWGKVKGFNGHHVATLPQLGNSVRLLGEMAFRRSQYMRTVFIPFGIMSKADQLFIGQVALEMIADEMKRCSVGWRTDAVKKPEYTGECCDCQHCNPNFPCCHLLRDRFRAQREHSPRESPRIKLSDFLQKDFAGIPLLVLSDVPDRWHRVFYLYPSLALPVHNTLVAHADKVIDYDPDAAMELFQRAIAAAKQSPRVQHELQVMIRRLKRVLTEPIAHDDIPDGTLLDPDPVLGPGQPRVWASRLSPLTYMKGRYTPSRRKPPAP
jgi:hypothetical protein